MKKAILVLFVGLALCFASPSVAKDANAWTEAQKLSYILGIQLGQLSKTSDLTVDIKMLSRGLKDYSDEKDPALSPQEIQDFMADLQQKAQAKQMAALNAAAEENLKKGQAFLDENKKKKGVKVTSSGLQYKVIKKGSGAKPTPSDTVKVHYRGTIANGKEFDNSYNRNQPLEIGVAQLIKGWQEGLQLMSVGSKYALYIPEDLAYGKNAPPTIGPSQALIFEVELLDISK